MITGQARARLAQAGAALAAAALIAGCGDAYRPVITPISTSGPAPQPSSYAVVVSSPAPTAPGIATIIDYSGDSVLAIAPIGPGPLAFTVDGSGTNGYTINSDGTITNFPVSSNLQQKLEGITTLPATAQPVNMLSPSSGLWIADLNGNVADVFIGSPETFKLAVPVATMPITLAGQGGSSGQREYAISQNFADATGMACNSSPRTAPATGLATPIETGSDSPDATIPLGKCPVYAVMTPDAQRLFVMNRGDDTITVINSNSNALDECTPFVNQNGQTVTCHPSLPLSTSAGLAQDTKGDVPAIAGPVYAEYNAATSQLVVADYDGGTISVIDVSLDQYGDDSPTFGTTYTIPVGKNPASVTALYDGSRAYSANQSDSTVTIVNLSSHTLEKTLSVVGHPRTVISTENSLYGKVYVASPDSPFLTIIETDTDLVDTTVLVEGNVVDVRVSTQNGVGSSQGSVANSNYRSRVPGYGQPCTLPPGLEPTPAGSQTALQVCQQIP
jgi:DNA-binding beta-propeller fold protein YncE